MICEFQDGLKVDYSGSLHITKGSRDVFIEHNAIPANYRGVLDWALHSHNCSDMRKFAEEVTEDLVKKPEVTRS